MKRPLPPIREVALTQEARAINRITVANQNRAAPPGATQSKSRAITCHLEAANRRKVAESPDRNRGTFVEGQVTVSRPPQLTQCVTGCLSHGNGESPWRTSKRRGATTDRMATRLSAASPPSVPVRQNPIRQRWSRRECRPPTGIVRRPSTLMKRMTTQG
jgi:hypothetical protein